MRQNKKLTLIIAVTLVLSLFSGLVYAGQCDPLTRLAGSDRYDTASVVAAAAYPEGAHTVIVTNGEELLGYADAFAASALAGALEAPILLTRAAYLPAETAAAITALGALQVVILGGTVAVSQDVEATLAGMVDTVERIGGDDRYETAALIAAYFHDDSKQLSPDAFIVNGHAPADSLVIGPWAASAGIPILMVYQDSIPTVTLNAIADMEMEGLIIIGGNMVVSENVENELDNLVDGSVTRIGGDNRFETSILVAQLFLDHNPEASYLLFGNGVSMVDAVSGGYYGGMLGAPVIYSRQDSLPSEIEEFLSLLTGGDFEGILLGGTQALSMTLEELISCYLTPPPSPIPSPIPSPTG